MEPLDNKISSFDDIGLITNQQKKPAEQKKLGQEDFMDLMLAQMNHQDPFKPMENGEFLTQMAQFSAVSGLKDIKDSFKSLVAVDRGRNLPRRVRRFLSRIETALNRLRQMLEDTNVLLPGVGAGGNNASGHVDQRLAEVADMGIDGSRLPARRILGDEQ